MLHLRSALIVDGTGAEPFRGDLLLEGDEITAVGPGLDTPPGARVVDADGLAASPGFIDMHAHSDTAALEGDHRAKLAQGCTSEIVGQDGLSYVPSDADTAPQLAQVLTAWNGEQAPPWRTVADYLAAVDAGSAANLGYLVPHGTVRLLAMGWDHREPTDAELARMKSLVDQGMREGALGLSAGLSYTPGMYADTAELVELCRVVAAHGGYYSPHQRSYGAGALEGYAEMLRIGRESGCAVHLAHATMNFAPNRGRANELTAMVDEAVDAGLDVTLDSYPYLAGSTMLSALLPSWTAEGGAEAQLELLRDPEQRRRIVRELDVVGTDGAHGVPVDWTGIEISGVADEGLAHLSGKSVAEAAGETAPAEFYLDLLIADRARSTCLMHVGDEDNLRHIMRHPVHTGSSDGLLHGTRIHPRAWGSFPRYLGHYVREAGVLGIAECVRHLTGAAAARAGIADRGLLAAGKKADVVLFDPDTVAAGSTYAEPRRLPEGIPYVFVNGRTVIDDGEPTGERAGRALRRNVRNHG
ncbi:N-acyl-D-amino-acid deacylase family protein [Salininema proteolyticum]|uniref:Amidohydrolase family protein n=1 Tax=Salininema proteolyticum TaxID=1607685 RepID=A0ABV8TU06_9ACTN